MTPPLHFSPAVGTPLCAFSAAVRLGAAVDPVGLEGFTRHTAELARRGAGGMTRAELDSAVDQIGATLDVEVDRDWLALSSTCLARHLDRAVALACAVLASPGMSEHDHEVLRRETLHELDDLRDDDASLADRHYHRIAAPGHPYCRTTLGTEDSLGGIERAAAASHHQRMWAADHLVVGVAGPVTTARAEEVAGALEQAVAGRRPLVAADGVAPPFPSGRRVYLIDKPGRNQCQMLLGHLAPPYGSDDFVALMPLEAAFGGLFTSRLMQEIRVARGWSYGAGSRLYKGRGAHWFRIWLAPTADVAPDALALTLSLYDQIAADGLRQDELELAVHHLTGSLPFAQATARQRMRLAVRHDLLGVPEEFPARLPERLGALTLDDVRRAADRWLRPRDLCIVIVASADPMAARLAAAGLPPTDIVPYRSY